ncbi:hypothetical protein EFM17_04160 [Lactobacillus delbrueckii]|nr:hypothetical protein [Lactobacillus delbrueckii]
MEKKKLKKWQIGMLIFLGMAAIGAVEEAVSPEQDSSPKTVKKAHKQSSKKLSSSSSSSSVSSSSSSSSSSEPAKAKESEDNERLVKAVAQYPKDFELAVVKSEVAGRDINIYLSNSYLNKLSSDGKERLCKNYWQLAVDDFNKYKKYTEQSTAFVHIYDQSGNELAKSNWGEFEYLGE